MLPLENELETLLAEWLSTLQADVYHVAAVVQDTDTRRIATLWKYPPPPPAELDVPKGSVAILGALRQIHTPAATGNVRLLPLDGFCGIALSAQDTLTGFYGHEWHPHITPDETNASLEWVIARYKHTLGS